MLPRSAARLRVHSFPSLTLQDLAIPVFCTRPEHRGVFHASHWATLEPRSRTHAASLAYKNRYQSFRYEKGLSSITATYSLRDDGKVSVVNRGIKADGKESVAHGRAKFASSPDAGHLRVAFFLWFYADYIITDLDSTYQWAMVASPPKYFWILSRMPRLDSAVVSRLVGRAAELGYDTSKLILTPQERPAAP